MVSSPYLVKPAMSGANSISRLAWPPFQLQVELFLPSSGYLRLPDWERLSLGEETLPLNVFWKVCSCPWTSSQCCFGQALTARDKGSSNWRFPNLSCNWVIMLFIKIRIHTERKKAPSQLSWKDQNKSRLFQSAWTFDLPYVWPTAL